MKQINRRIPLSPSLFLAPVHRQCGALCTICRLGKGNYQMHTIPRWGWFRKDKSLQEKTGEGHNKTPAGTWGNCHADFTGECGSSCMSNCPSWTWFQMDLTKEIEFHPCWEALEKGEGQFQGVLRAFLPLTSSFLSFYLLYPFFFFLRRRNKNRY